MTKTVQITIRKQGNGFNVSPNPARVNRADSVKFDSDAGVRLSFQTNRDWFKPDLPAQAAIQAGGQRNFQVRGKSEKNFPQGQNSVTVQYGVEAAAQARGAPWDPDIIIEEC